MTNGAGLGARTSPLSIDAVARLAQQGRSRALFARVMAASRDLMIERACEDFTLQDVSKIGNASIGSIYLRFKSKENLVRAVIGEELERISLEEAELVASALAKPSGLAAFLQVYVESYAEFLRRHTPMLRIAMLRASHDDLVSEAGKESAARSARIAVAAILSASGSAPSEDAVSMAKSAYQVIYATLARQLSLGGLNAITLNDLDWATLKRELARMAFAYLTSCG